MLYNIIIFFQLVLNIMSEPPRRQKLRHVNTLTDVVRLIKNSKKIIVLTGAGVSVSCGIPDFRSRDGIYSRLAQDFPDLPDPQVTKSVRHGEEKMNVKKQSHVTLSTIFFDRQCSTSTTSARILDRSSNSPERYIRDSSSRVRVTGS